MAFLKLKNKAFIITGCHFVLLAAFVLIALAFKNQSPNKIFEEYKNSDALEDYIVFLFENLDNQTEKYLHKGDSVLKTIWREPGSADEQLVYYNLLINYGYHLLQSGYISQSIQWYEKALNYYRQNNNPKVKKEMYYEEFVAKPLANNYTRIGDFSKARVVLNDAIRSATNNQDVDIIPSLHLNLATTYFWMQKFDSVQTIADAGLHNILNNSPVAIALYNIKTEAFLESKQMDSALLCNKKAIEKSEDKLTGWEATTFINAAKIALAKNNYKEAYRILKKVVTQHFQLSSREKAKILVLTGDAYLSGKAPAEALKYYRQSLEMFNLPPDGLFPDFTVTNAYYGIANALSEYDDISVGSWYEKAMLNGYYTQMLLSSSMMASNSIYADEQNTKKGLKWLFDKAIEKKDDDAIKKIAWLVALNKSRKLFIEQFRTSEWENDSIYQKNKLLFEELKNEYVLLAQAETEEKKSVVRKRIESQEYDLQLKEHNFSRIIKIPSFINFKRWLAAYSTNHTIISYIYFDSAYGRLTFNQGQASIALISEDSLGNRLNQFVKDYFDPVGNQFANNPNRYFFEANYFYKVFLSDTLELQPLVLISADDALHRLPFEALSKKEDNPEFLITKHAFIYSPSLIANTSENNNTQHLNISAFSFNKEHLGFSAIPKAKEEIRYLKKNFNSSIFAAENVSKSEFFERLENPEVVHLATHAVATDSLDQPFIVLKDKLYLGELQYAIIKSPLVVLSACESGTGKLSQNEGMLSLGRSFISKGVPGVISTRWEIDDDIAPQIMIDFYQQLNKSYSPAMALQKAQKQYVSEAKSLAALNPVLWAGFYFQGVEQPLILRSSTHFGWWLLLLILPVYFLIKYFLKKQGNNF